MLQVLSVLLRYPYISLVATRDGDIFEREKASKDLIKVLQYTVLAGLIVLMLVVGSDLWIAKQREAWRLIVFLYAMVFFFFMCFLTFRYDPVSHPTIATFLHATLGIGAVLLPIYIPILLVGSTRCKRLLDSKDSVRHP